MLAFALLARRLWKTTKPVLDELGYRAGKSDTPLCLPRFPVVLSTALAYVRIDPLFAA